MYLWPLYSIDVRAVLKPYPVTPKREFLCTDVLLLLTDVTIENDAILMEVNISNVLSILWH